VPLSRAELLRLVAEEACRDGVVDPREKKLLELLVELLKVERAEALAIVHLANERAKAGELGAKRPLDGEALYRGIVEAVLADGQMDRVEARMLEAMRRLLDIPPALARELARAIGAARFAKRDEAPAAPGLQPPDSSLQPSEVKVFVDEVAARAPSTLALPEHHAAEAGLRARALALADTVADAEAGALARAMARIGCPPERTVAVARRAARLGEPFEDVAGDGERAERLVATAAIERAQNLVEAGLHPVAGQLLDDVLRHLTDRAVRFDLQEARKATMPVTIEALTDGNLKPAPVTMGALCAFVGAFPLGLTGALLGAGVGVLLSWREIDQAYGIRVDRRGITAMRRTSEHTIAWALIRTMHAGARDVHTRYGYAGTVVTFRLALGDGTSFHFCGRDSTRQGGPWMAALDAVQTALAPRIGERDRKAFRAHGVVGYGPITMTRNGLRVPAGWFGRDTRVLVWDAIERLAFDGRQLAVYEKNASWSAYTVDAIKIPNFFALCMLLEERGFPVA
jgi:uncharacterized tellurite resistance protein B-like protein